MNYKPVAYSIAEEKFNVVSHAFGLVLSVVALVLLIIKASIYGTIWHQVSFTIFGTSMIILYSASTFYHNAKTLKLRERLNIFDHAAIYVLIAGTYTPFTLVTLHGETGWWVFSITWSCALIGIILKLFFTGRYNKISTLMYVLMGWLVVFVKTPLLNNLPIEGVYWLLAGGISYTIGAILFSLNNLKFNHAIFHVFVLIGTFCHFISVYFYVLKIG